MARVARSLAARLLAPRAHPRLGARLPRSRDEQSCARLVRTSSSSAVYPDDVNDIIKETVDGVLQNQDYAHPLVGQWTNDVVAQCVRRLTALGKPFKYVVTCVLLQRTGAGLHTASSCYWDTETDGSRTVRWENKTMYCIVSVFGLAI